MSAITVGGDLVHYEVLGRGGRPVILIHGWLGSWRYWIPTMRLLQLKFRVYAIDLFGYGDSGKNPERYAISHQVLLLDEFMKQLALPKAAMIGHGLGAQVTTEFAYLYPQRVARMLLVSAPLFGVPDLGTRQPLVERRVMLTDSAALKARLNSGEPLADKSTLSRDEIEDPADKVADPTFPNLRNKVTSSSAQVERETVVVQGLPIIPKSDGQSAPQGKKVVSRARVINPLQGILSGSMESLLLKCFRRSEPQYEKLYADVQRSDDRVLHIAAEGFDAGLLLDKLRLLDVPVGAIHGDVDPVIDPPDETVWNYLTETKEDKFLPVSLPNVRHFPMLEAETFQRIVGQFLETPDISKIELKERWRRRAR